MDYVKLRCFVWKRLKKVNNYSRSDWILGVVIFVWNTQVTDTRKATLLYVQTYVERNNEITENFEQVGG